MAHRLGITNDFPVTRSLALGVASVCVLDMTSSYAVFASGGYKTPAFGITRITNLRGELVYQHDPDAPRPRVLERHDRPGDELDVAQCRGRRHRHGAPMSRACPPPARPARPRPIAMPGSAASPAITSPRCGWAMTTTTRPTGVTGGSLPATIWQKFMAFAHSNIEIKPAFGIDFTPAPFKPATETARADEDAATLQAADAQARGRQKARRSCRTVPERRTDRRRPRRRCRLPSAEPRAGTSSCVSSSTCSIPR